MKLDASLLIEVDTFNDPHEALSKYKPEYYDLIVLDIKMPSMDSFELYRKIQKLDGKAKVCFLTTSEMYYEEFRRKKYSALDKDLFICKPVENEELIKEINRLIGK